MSQEDKGLRTDVQIPLIEGDADTFKLAAVKRLAKGWLGDDLAYGLVSVDAHYAGVKGVMTELASGSLMATKRLVVVRDISALSTADQKAVGEVIKSLPPDVAVALVARKPASDGRGGGPKLSQALRNLARKSGQALKISGPGPKGLVGWVSQQVQRYEKHISGQAARALVEAVGDDVDCLLVELAKLSTYIGDRDEINEDDVAAVTAASAQQDIWGFLDAIGERNATKAFRLLDGMLPQVAKSGDAIMLLGSIARQLRILWQVRMLHMDGVLPGNPESAPADVAAKLPSQHNAIDAVKGRDWLLRNYSAQARKFGDADLARALDRVYTADKALKGQGGSQDHHTVMELLVAELCGQ